MRKTVLPPAVLTTGALHSLLGLAVGLTLPAFLAAVLARAQSQPRYDGTRLVGICASGELQVYTKDAANGWAKTKCAPALNIHELVKTLLAPPK